MPDRDGCFCSYPIANDVPRRGLVAIDRVVEGGVIGRQDDIVVDARELRATSRSPGRRTCRSLAQLFGGRVRARARFAGSPTSFRRGAGSALRHSSSALCRCASTGCCDPAMIVYFTPVAAGALVELLEETRWSA